MTDLATSVLAVVAAEPYLSSNGVSRRLRARKDDVLRELGRLCQEGLLTFEPGPRASRSWHLLPSPRNRFPLPSGSSGTGPGTESRRDGGVEG